MYARYSFSLFFNIKVPSRVFVVLNDLRMEFFGEDSWISWICKSCSGMNIDFEWNDKTFIESLGISYSQEIIHGGLSCLFSGTLILHYVRFRIHKKIEWKDLSGKSISKFSSDKVENRAITYPCHQPAKNQEAN